MKDKFGVEFSEDSKQLIKCPTVVNGNYIISEGVEVICQDAFRDCVRITSIQLPDSITKIENNAFKGCTKLAGVAIPNTLLDISPTAFDASSTFVYRVIDPNYKYGTIENFNDCKKNINALLEKTSNTDDSIANEKKRIINKYLANELEYGGTLKSKSDILQLVQFARLDKELFSTFIDVFVEKRFSEDLKSGQQFISELKEDLAQISEDNSLDDMDKEELDEIAQEKADVILSAEPETPSEILEFMQYVVTLNYYRYDDLRAKVISILKNAINKYSSHQQILKAKHIANLSKWKYLLIRIVTFGVMYSTPKNLNSRF